MLPKCCRFFRLGYACRMHQIQVLVVMSVTFALTACGPAPTPAAPDGAVPDASAAEIAEPEVPEVPDTDDVDDLDDDGEEPESKSRGQGDE